MLCRESVVFCLCVCLCAFIGVSMLDRRTCGLGCGCGLMVDTFGIWRGEGWDCGGDDDAE
jgi:hypothetical protein